MEPKVSDKAKKWRWKRAVFVVSSVLVLFFLVPVVPIDNIRTDACERGLMLPVEPAPSEACLGTSVVTLYAYATKYLKKEQRRRNH